MSGGLQAARVANEFLALGAKEPGFPAIDQMKLQKLLFYAHAWHLAMRDEPLIVEEFEAWPWGPLVTDVYYQTRKFGRSAVTEPLNYLSFDGDHFGVSTNPIPNSFSNEKAFVKSVWDTHKQFTGVQLSNATHAPGEPWSFLKSQYGTLDNRPTIPNDLIKSIFKKKRETAG